MGVSSKQARRSNMFERLGEIIANKERYEGDENDHDALPAIFWWFPKQEDFIPPPPSDETCLEKMDRISSTIKVKELVCVAMPPCLRPHKIEQGLYSQFCQSAKSQLNPHWAELA